MSKENGEITSEDLVVIHERNYGSSGLMVMRIVQFFKDGKKLGAPKLENREFYYDKSDGIRKCGKSRGFDFKDMQLILQKKDEILTHLQFEL